MTIYGDNKVQIFRPYGYFWPCFLFIWLSGLNIWPSGFYFFGLPVLAFWFRPSALSLLLTCFKNYIKNPSASKASNEVANLTEILYVLFTGIVGNNT